MTSVSVIVETLTARTQGPIADVVDVVLSALAQQVCRPSEVFVVLTDDEDDDAAAAALARNHPDVFLIRIPRCNYFAMKNAGAVASSSDVIAFVDGDSVPDDDGWLGELLAGIDAGADAVAGQTAYRGGGATARTFTVSDFANTARNADGSSTGFNINNVAFRRDVFMRHKLDERIPRDGGCYLLYHTLRAEGADVRYEPRARATHAIDAGPLGFVRKHFNRGADGLVVYRLDAAGVLRGSRLVQRSGVMLLPLTARRIMLDWARLVRMRDQIGISLPTVPYYAAVMVATRTIELAGGLQAARSWRLSTIDVEPR